MNATNDYLTRNVPDASLEAAPGEESAVGIETGESIRVVWILQPKEHGISGALRWESRKLLQPEVGHVLDHGI